MEELELECLKLASQGLKLCPGIQLPWLDGRSVLDSYPFQLHLLLQKSLGFHFCHVFGHDQEFWIRSNTCRRSIPKEVLQCHECTALPTSKALRDLQNRARNAPPHTNYHYLNFTQLVDLLYANRAQINDWKLMVRIVILTSLRLFSHYCSNIISYNHTRFCQRLETSFLRLDASMTTRGW